EHAGKPAEHLPILATDPVRGEDDALVTLVAFEDFQCPYCARAEATIAELEKSYGRDLRVVWKDNPLPFHVSARPAARLARVAFLAGGAKNFWALHDKIFADQKSIVSYGAYGTDGGPGSATTTVQAWAASFGADATAV